MARTKSDPPEQEPEREPGAAGATDGDPNPDELARRRAQNEKGTSIDARSQDDTEPEEELFPLGSLDGDPAVTLKTLIKSRIPTEISASMGTAAVPIKGSGFFDPEQEVTLLVRVLPGGPVPVATRKKGDEKSKIEKWRITQPLTPIYVQEAGSVYTREQVLDMLHEAGVPDGTVAKVLGEESAAAQA